jgi:hypothetical protein
MKKYGGGTSHNLKRMRPRAVLLWQTMQNVQTTCISTNGDAFNVPTYYMYVLKVYNITDET